MLARVATRANIADTPSALAYALLAHNGVQSRVTTRL
jgi:hypothetical protein